MLGGLKAALTGHGMSVVLRLNATESRPGDRIAGEAIVRGGTRRQQAKRLAIGFARIAPDGGQDGPPFAQIELGEIDLAASDSQRRSFELPVPLTLPPTIAPGDPEESPLALGVHAVLDVAWKVPQTDLVAVQVGPGPGLEPLLGVFEQAGCTFDQLVVEPDGTSGALVPMRARLAFEPPDALEEVFVVDVPLRPGPDALEIDVHLKRMSLDQQDFGPFALAYAGVDEDGWARALRPVLDALRTDR